MGTPHTRTPADEFAAAAEKSGYFAAVIEAPDRVDLRGLTPEGWREGAMRFQLRVLSGEEVWRYAYPARPTPAAPDPPFFSSFTRHPQPADFDRLGWWWRHLESGPGWQYHPEDWMRPQAWPRWAREAA